MPLASFDPMDTEQQKLCFYYTNLQPLWGEENREKGTNYISVLRAWVEQATFAS
jgi:hypothetical protein